MSNQPFTVEIDSPKFVMGGTYKQPLVERVRGLLSRPGPELAAAQYDVHLDDVSVYQGKIDFDIMRQVAQCVYVRAGFGNNGVDVNGQANAAGAKAAGMPWGLYWYVKVGKDFKQHVQNFYNVWQQYGGVLPPVFDCEYTEVDKSATTGWLTKLVNLWISTTGVQPMIYTRASWWDYRTSRMDWPKQLDLWVAQYSSTITNPAIPNDWGAVNNPRTWTLWQWSADGNDQGAAHGVQSDDIDRNRFNGTIEAFNTKYGTAIQPLGGITPPPPPPPPTTGSRVVVTATINPRTRPVIDPSTDAGTITVGAVFEKAGAPNNGFQPVKVWLSEQYLDDLP